GLFVKNLENVQGDERDVVLFSTAFSANEQGTLPLNFGPLNRAGGERRLNVAVTRARRQVIVYASFDPEQLRAEETTSVGIKHLRTYLEMAAKGASVLPYDGRRRGDPDRHRDEIAARLRDRGLAVRTDVGLSGFALDLVLGEPADPRVAVLLDGRAWSRRMTARDRDALPREVLTDVLGWPAVERIWLPDWLADPTATVDRLVAVATTAPAPASATWSRGEASPRGAGPPEFPGPDETHPAGDPDVGGGPGGAGDPSEAGGPDGPGGPGGAGGPDGPGGPDQVGGADGPRRVSSPSEADDPSGAGVFEPWVVGRLGPVEVLDALPRPDAAAQVAAALRAAVTAEGPIHTDRLARLVANAYGLNRVVETRKTAILRHLPPDLRRDDLEPVVWPPGRDPDSWPGYRRTPADADRPLEHVPLREIVNAMVTCTRASAGMPPDELHRVVLAIFGGRRLTTGIADRLDTALRTGRHLNRLTHTNGIVLPTP
ncbi:MAG TPA: DUF3320 domain-containing protein, partial [Mycobacteriales bacterium]|nr:DUF3320 domain-containing protein [Mycobacteriales bacterium]